MLTPELINVRRQKGQLFLVPLGARKESAIELANELLTTAESFVGQSREGLEDAWDAISIEPRDRKLKEGLCKLIEDKLAFDVETPLDPVELRRRVFHRANLLRRSSPSFDRDAVLAEVAAEVELTPGALEQALFADLKNAHVVRAKLPGGELVPGGAAALVAGYDLGQRQAVLLRATQVVAELRDPDRRALRALFRKLKFFRLLFDVQQLAGGLVHLRIDGPFSLFESITKYGLSLALALPWIESVGEHRITADLRWGKERLPLTFVIEGQRRPSTAESPSMPEELETLLRRLADRADLRWTVTEADVLLEAKGMGVVIPDLMFVHQKTKRVVYLELMGYWSRDAVFKRIEMVDAGLLSAPVIFCASERLRVSEEALESPHAALLTYKGTISPSALLEKLEKLA